MTSAADDSPKQSRWGFADSGQLAVLRSGRSSLHLEVDSEDLNSKLATVMTRYSNTEESMQFSFSGSHEDKLQRKAMCAGWAQ